MTPPVTMCATMLSGCGSDPGPEASSLAEPRAEAPDDLSNPDLVEVIVERGEAAHLLESPQQLRRHPRMPDAQQFEQVAPACCVQPRVESLPGIEVRGLGQRPDRRRPGRRSGAQKSAAFATGSPAERTPRSIRMPVAGPQRFIAERDASPRQPRA